MPSLQAGDEHGVDEVCLATPAHLVRGGVKVGIRAGAGVRARDRVRVKG